MIAAYFALARIRIALAQAWGCKMEHYLNQNLPLCVAIGAIGGLVGGFILVTYILPAILIFIFYGV